VNNNNSPNLSLKKEIQEPKNFQTVKVSRH